MSTAPFDGFRTQRPYDHGMRPGQESLVHDNRFYEAGGLFNAVNKGKKDCVINLNAPEGREAFLSLVANSDGLVANFSAHVLPHLGLDFDTINRPKHCVSCISSIEVIPIIIASKTIPRPAC